jgi:hypothetical protein
MNVYEFLWIHGNICEFIWICMDCVAVGQCGSAAVRQHCVAVRTVVCAQYARQCAAPVILVVRWTKFYQVHVSVYCMAEHESVCGSVWQCNMNVCELIWITMNNHAFTRINMNLDEQKWICMRMNVNSYGFIWIYMNWNNSIWIYMWIYVNMCEFRWI